MTLDAIQLLIEKGADITARASNGWNVMRYVAMRDVDEIPIFMKALKDLGAEVTDEDRAWWSAYEDVWKGDEGKEKKFPVVRSIFFDQTAKTLEGTLALRGHLSAAQ